MTTKLLSYPEALAKLSVEGLTAKCIEDGDCLRWQGAKNGDGHGRMYVREGGRYKTLTVRRAMWCLHHGISELPAVKYVSVTCDTVDCINHEHLTLTTRRDISRKSNARPEVRVKRMVSAAKTARLTQARINIELAREIRETYNPGGEGHVTCTEWAALLEINPSRVGAIRQGRAWKDFDRPMANPFAGLLEKQK